IIQQSIDNGYRKFLAHVAEARHMTTEQVDKIARGRIWSGEDAKGLGLVDQLGGLSAAIESAAKRAKLEKGYRVFYIEKEKSFREQVAEMLTTGVSSIVGSGDPAAAEAPAASRFSVAGQLLEIQRELAEVARWNDPRGIYAHCLCGD
ncbi:MAG TPA: S49 family peptidase, partial [Myxococcota bacterium]|nr:S49 family peptidase [Myxococcota bacterium]